MVAGYLLATGSTSTLRAGVLGLCGSVASLSAYAVLTVSQPPRLSIAFLVGTPRWRSAACVWFVGGQGRGAVSRC